ncbi:biotin--[acetyl-CoA-carboxylase] ligase [Allopontixanthobacter sp.]|uniref:biotin--[acetyl-CoA-carboxylase] ligase n=1 Tax=Allopontixanthobacter sp. TaxID=2906452 RepID=UPI002AB98FAD|nr:biotin--[acetyl-CoA-carboxylase] ligase [Allopontixanthobacter sp.]MDZ4308904.1 biotin--[acetyl-CoA-carboxylase] ligase [Allopontixanthobacter sp.]
MIETVPRTGSTNGDLSARLKAGERIAEGHWLVADRQSAGRGRQGREWFDGTGNFMGSTVVHLSPGDPFTPTLALVAGLASYQAVVPHCPDPVPLLLKWPNDLMYAGAKLAGILLEREGDSVIVGIGVNLAAAPQVAGRETLALAKFGPAPDRDLFAHALAGHFAEELQRWRTYGTQPLINRWESTAHPAGTALTVNEQTDGIISGVFDGLLPDGSLRLRLADGTSRAIHAGDVMLA